MSKKNGMVRASVDAGLAELAGKVPGGSTALRVVQAVFHRRAEQRAQELFTRIAVETGAQDWDAAAELMGGHVGEPWFDEAVEAGFRDLMDCFDPVARKCIAVLVAEYVMGRKAPDVRFRRVGGVLRESDSNMLSTLVAIAGGYVEVLQQEPMGIRVLVRSTRRPNTPDEVWVFAFGGEQHATSQRFDLPQNLDECVSVLTGNGIGYGWTGLSSAQFGGDPLVRLADDDDQAMTLLHTCISAGLPRCDES